MQLAVGRDADDAVKPVAAGRMIALADADAGHLAADALAGLFLLLLPLEHLGSLVERLLLEGAGDRALIGTHLARRLRRVDPADREPIDAKLARCLVDHRLDDRCELIFSRTTLWPNRRRVSEHRDGAPPHCGRLIKDRQCVAGSAEVATADVRTVFLHDVEVGCEQFAVLAEPKLDAPLEARARAADAVFLNAGNAVHHRPVDLPR